VARRLSVVGDKLYAVGPSGSIQSSGDGRTWTAETSGTTQVIMGVTLGSNGVMVAVGGPGTILQRSVSPTQTDSTVRLMNLSNRGQVSQTQPLIGGFVVNGSGAKRFLIRAIGPSLRGFGVPTAISDPTLTLYDGSGKAIATNDDWGLQPDASTVRSVTVLVGAFTLTEGTADSAVVVSLSSGSYTAQARSKSVDGEVLLEIYALD